MDKLSVLMEVGNVEGGKIGIKIKPKELETANTELPLVLPLSIEDSLSLISGLSIAVNKAIVEVLEGFNKKLDE